MSLALMVGLCSMLLAGFAGAPENAEQNWKTYRSEKFGFEIAYPAGMELKLSAASCGESLILVGTTPFVLLAYPAASRGEYARSGFKAYFDGASASLKDAKTGGVLAQFEAWPPGECPRQPADTVARTLGIERAKAVTQTDGPDGSSF